MSLNGPGAPAPPMPLPRGAASLIGGATQRLSAYAFAVPHTATRAGRSCKSCHADPRVFGWRGVTTRTTLRPLEPESQARAAQVGECLACHAPETSRALYREFELSLTRKKPACR
jgi:hypothetical protein